MYTIQKKRSVNDAAAVGGNEKSNQERIKRHSPISHPGVSSASLQTL